MALKVMKDFSEIVPYEIPNLPLYISRAKLSAHFNLKFLGHWHDDVEIVKPLHGNMTYEVNGKKFLLREGDALIVNAQQMHYGYSPNGADCEYLCVLFQPLILTSNQIIRTKYIEPIIYHPNIDVTFLERDDENNFAILAAIDKFLTLPKVAGNELEFLSLAGNFWRNWFEFLNFSPLTNYKVIDRNIDLQKNMVEFIYKNYRRKISLAEIAKAGGVCKSLCCQIFKKYLGKSPIDFLNSYRLQIGMNLLGDSKMSVTEISALCGFNSPSYFSEMFFKFKGCTPSDFRGRKVRA